MRKGYRRRQDIPPTLLRHLNAGTAEAVTLIECLAVDLAKLMRNCFPDLDAQAIRPLVQAKDSGWVARTRLAGEILFNALGTTTALKATLNHTSDQVRGWGAAILAADTRLSVKESLNHVRAIADDHNACVRETAWIMLRPRIADHLGDALDDLEAWTQDPKPNLRRYACEITRPRGVWCAHIKALRANPHPGLRILTPLRHDPSRYVQNSVANWLNDAAKDHPAWVATVTSQWEKSNNSKELNYILRRARRNLSDEFY